MADSRPSTADEKATASTADKHRGIFSRKKSPTVLDNNIDEKGNEKGNGTITEVKPVVPEVAAISFTQLFRYSTKYELFIDAIGIVAAIGAGAAQVCTDSLPRGDF
jgi:ATP-binding cassette subfamily B (MDR/TAP) protein 1